MNIKDAAQASGLPAKTIRYYEEVGLVAPLRAANGYRRYRPRDVDRLTFLAHARALGFSIDDCRALIALREDPHRASATVKAIAQGHLTGIDDKISALHAMREQLVGMIAACPGDAGPDCAILDGIARKGGTDDHTAQGDAGGSGGGTGRARRGHDAGV
jgi:Cu(I)-responsive transcriptional regulator